MDEYFARLTKAGRIACGRQHADGGYYCDEPLAEFDKEHPGRRLTALPGWRQDRKGIWRKTTSVEDRRAHGVAGAMRRTMASPELPALACCPKCAALQWLDAGRLNLETPPDREIGTHSRWIIRA